MTKKIFNYIFKFTKGILDTVFTVASVLCLFLAVVSYYLAKWVIDTWGLLTIDEIIFHLKVPLEGTNEEMVWEAVNLCVPVALIAVLSLMIIFIALRKRNFTRYFIWFSVMAFSIFLVKHSVDYVWNELKVDDYIESQKTQSTFIQDNYVDPRSVEITFPEQKRNLIYIFLESMETTYASQDVGGGASQNYIPELTSLAQNNISFSNTEGLGGAYTAVGSTWTMGGMFAQTSGLPLSIPIDGNAMSGQEEFLPEVMSIGDILEEQGYKQVLMIGSDATFGGRRNYFSQHGNYDIWDYNRFSENEILPSGYKVYWGYEDQKLFEFSKEKLTELSQSEQPFNFTMLTVDTHFEDGYVCPLCPTEYPSRYANIMACSSKQVAEFVEWIKQQPFYANTTVIISGDHKTMQSSKSDFFAEINPKYDRRVYNAFLNSVVSTAETKKREFNTMDMFPTTLASMGVIIKGNKLGLGTNLLSGEPTLTEQYGHEKINEELNMKSSFWENFTKGIVID